MRALVRYGPPRRIRLMVQCQPVESANRELPDPDSRVRAARVDQTTRQIRYPGFRDRRAHDIGAGGNVLLPEVARSLFLVPSSRVACTESAAHYNHPWLFSMIYRLLGTHEHLFPSEFDDLLAIVFDNLTGYQIHVLVP